MSRLITTNDLMEKLKVSRTAINNWRNEGMPYEKLGKLVRFDEDAVINWLKNRGRQFESK